MRLNLLVTQGTSKGKAITINKPEFAIGRDPSCNLRPASQAVSKRHCILRMRDDQAFIEDLKSTNGTFLNEQQIQGERELRHGDRLKIGPLDFVVQLETAAQVEKPTQVDKETKPPTPALKPAAPASAAKPEAVDDDAIGSMLLSLTDDEKAAANGEENADGEGSTVMQVLKPEELEQLQAASSDKTPYRPAPPKAAKDPNTSSAAKNILEKYRRRPKT